MNKNKEIVIKITAGALLAALSVVLKLAFDMWLRVENFGFPFYSIPLILSGMFLGPYYALMVGFVADTVSGLYLGYLPLFVFSTLAWSVVPSLLTKKTKGVLWWAVILMTYLISTSLNTLAMMVHFNFDIAIKLLPLRLSVIPAFGPIIAVTTNLIYERLKETKLNFRNK